MHRKTQTIRGTPVSRGLALGPVHVVRDSAEGVPEWTVPEDDLPSEVGRLAAALTTVREELERRRRVVAGEAGESDAEIFAVHAMILQDPGALKEVESAIQNQRVNAEAAVQMLIQRFEKTLGNLEGDSVRGVAADVSDPWRRVLLALTARDREDVIQRDEPVVLAAANLTPQVVTFLDRERILAVITESGGRYSHGAVLANSFGIPCVMGLPNLLARLEQDLVVSVDGDQGVVQLRPDAEDIEVIRQRQERFAVRRKLLAAEAELPATSSDGVPLAIRTNVESMRDLDTFDAAHCDGIGLLRTEFLYMERPQFPSEEEQYRLYRRMLERMADGVVTIRTLDVGGDKPLPYFKQPAETNPALGWRGLRISLSWRDLLQVQLRAILRASHAGNLRILLPMVTSREEVRDVRQIFDELRAQLLEQGHEIETSIPVGVMVEVPSVLFTLPEILDAVDFVSVGTNDLVQYLLAVDRDNPWVAGLYTPCHPAVVRALGLVAREAAAHERPCSVCGEIAGDPAWSVLLFGLGYDELSVVPHILPDVKYALRRVSREEARGWAERALAQVDVAGVEAILAEIRDSVHGEAGL